jgi:hypothetical protein
MQALTPVSIVNGINYILNFPKTVPNQHYAFGIFFTVVVNARRLGFDFWPIFAVGAYLNKKLRSK